MRTMLAISPSLFISPNGGSTLPDREIFGQLPTSSHASCSHRDSFDAQPRPSRKKRRVPQPGCLNVGCTSNGVLTEDSTFFNGGLQP